MDVLKDFLKIVLFLFVPFLLMLPVASCMQKQNEEKRQEQIKTCRASGGEYIKSLKLNASPYDDSCKLPA